jgi:hypothetical protein
VADSEVRQKFEEVARQILSGGITRAPAVNLFDRNPHYPDEYKFRDVQVAWKTYQAGMRAGEIARTERSEKDYAIECAEYLAKAVEHYQSTKNAFAEFMESADRDRDEEVINKFRSDLSEAWRGMNSCIFEFRKRVHVIAVSQSAEKGGAH